MKTLRMMIATVLALTTSRAIAQQGLRAEYFNGTDFDKKILTRVDPEINFVWRGTRPAAGVDMQFFSVRWTGKLLAPATGRYKFMAQVDDGVRIWVGGQQIMDEWQLHDNSSFTGWATLTAGQYYDLRIDYFNDIREGEVRIYWQLPEEAKRLPDVRDATGNIIAGKYLSQTAKPTPARVPAAKKPLWSATAPVTPKLPGPAETDLFKRLKSGDTLVMKSVVFEVSSYELLESSFAELNRLTKTLEAYPALRVEIAGHTDYVGDPRLNQTLSERRAQSVAQYLMERGISANRIKSTGHGGLRPIVRSASAPERIRNRRVEVVAR
ncbi:MAG: OmpA family protein [Cytophagaceae bacterium]|nr:OmpA family protein [Cytophagaceae bacterium]